MKIIQSWGFIFLGLIILGIVGVVWWYPEKDALLKEGMRVITPPSVKRDEVLQTFASAEEFREYRARGEERRMFFALRGRGTPLSTSEEVFADADTTKNTIPKVEISRTNVQAEGIDEPDIVKTDGTAIFVARESASGVFFEEMVRGSTQRIARPLERSVEIAGVDNPEEMKSLSRILGQSGKLFLGDDRLVILGDKGIVGYNVRQKENPEKLWSIDLREGDIADARLMEGKMFLVHRSYVNYDIPCPFVPFSVGEKQVEIACSDIAHPYAPIPTDVVYTIMRVSLDTGLVEEKTSLVGSLDTNIALFPGGLYVWYPEFENMLDVMYDFLRNNNTVVSQELFLELEKLRGYDISEESKTRELLLALDAYRASLSPDARLKFQNDLENALSGYLEEHKRDLTHTNIFRFDTRTLETEESGRVPGTLLNQFSLDEYNGYVRVATTVANNTLPLGNSTEEENDVYILDENMRIVGNVLGMGEGERVYSARFVGDRGYVVTFKQTDPFYVLDLRDPKNPKVTGEIKIPGYSSYLHPLANDRVLGIGKEGEKVKATLFDVSDIENPQELSTYLLDESWSEILSTHHAFALKEDSRLFFLPGTRGGYVFSYDDDAITLASALRGESIRRAVYIGDFWYFVGEEGIVSYAEEEWKPIGEMVFDEE